MACRCIIHITSVPCNIHNAQLQNYTHATCVVLPLKVRNFTSFVHWPRPCKSYSSFCPFFGKAYSPKQASLSVAFIHPLRPVSFEGGKRGVHTRTGAVILGGPICKLKLMICIMKVRSYRCYKIWLMRHLLENYYYRAESGCWKLKAIPGGSDNLQCVQDTSSCIDLTTIVPIHLP